MKIKKYIFPLVLAVGAFIAGFLFKSIFEKEDFVEPKGDYIDVRVARELADTFKLTRIPILESFISTTHRQKHQETRSVWFSFDDLAGLLAKHRLEHLGTSRKNLGMRIYFGTYGNTHPKYPRQLTVFFVPTIKKERPRTRLMVDSDDVKLPTKKLLMLDPYNHGTLCPPESCYGSSF